MLVAEYDYDTDIAVQREEAGRIAFAKGISQGIQQGFEQGAYQKARETAKNLTEMGFSVESIAKATGLSLEEIENL